MAVRKNIRLQEYDYSTQGMYFVTICVQNMKHLFGSVTDNNMVLNENGMIINEILKSFRNEKYCIEFYQIMPNHLHFIVEIKNDGIITLSQIISILKSRCTFKLKTRNLWQRGYYERVIRNEKEYNSVIKYINENPYREKYNW